jgi:predicted transcriptional regulator
MIVNVSLLNTDLVISAILAFIAGMAGVIVYNRVKNMSRRPDYRVNDTIVEAVVLEYTRRLRDYDRAIAELRIRLDVIEARLPHLHVAMPQQPQHVLSQSHQSQPHAASVSEPVTVTQHATGIIEEKQENNGTIAYILKLLVERPRSSREIQHAIGRTREHTSRLMKKLHELGFVSRDANSKPFKYAITDSGRRRLKEKTEIASEPSAVV